MRFLSDPEKEAPKKWVGIVDTSAESKYMQSNVKFCEDALYGVPPAGFICQKEVEGPNEHKNTGRREVLALQGQAS